VIGYVDVVTERAFRYGDSWPLSTIASPQLSETEKAALTG